MYELPLFPLHTVLFPGMPIYLHIFEPRYRLMVKTCIDQDRPFGVALIRNGEEAESKLAQPHPTGCTARIVQVDRLEDGSMNLALVGEDRFRIHELQYGQPYLMGRVESWPIERPYTLGLLRGVNGLRAGMRAYLNILRPLIEAESGQSPPEMSFPDDALQLLYLGAAILQLPAVEKQPLLEKKTAFSLLRELQRIFHREIALLPRLLLIEDAAARRLAWLN